MKIAQLFENDIEEARRNNWGREQSHATGQQYGREFPQALPAADQQAAIQKGQAQAAQGQAQADLRARLAQHKAQKAAAPAQTTAKTAEPAQAAPAAAASPLSDEEREAHKAAGGKFDPQTGAAIPLEPAAQQQDTTTQQTGQAPAAKPSLTKRVTGALRKAGDVGAAVTGAVGNVGAGFFGGMKRGYSQQASGGAPVSWSSQSAAPVSSGEEQVIQSLMARVSNLERQLSATAESYQFESKFLGKWI